MAKRTWSDQQLVDAVKYGNSLSDALKTLGFGPTGSRAYWMKKHIKRLNLDTSHFKRANPKGIKKDDDSLLFVKDCQITWSVVRKRLRAKNLLDFSRCSSCGVSTWVGSVNDYIEEPLSLQVDHINGINNDNRLENLRVLCPNCHSMTNTFCAKNMKRVRLFTTCNTCCKSIEDGKKRCEECARAHLMKSKFSSFPWPDNERLLKDINGLNNFKAAQKIGCSVQGLLDHLRKRGLLEQFRKSRDFLILEMPIKKELLDNLHKHTFTELGVHYKVSRTTVRNWCKRYGITVKYYKDGAKKIMQREQRGQLSSCPPKEILQDLIWKYPTTKIAKMYSVSDKAVEKWCKKYNLSKPPRGYWAKQYSISGRQKDVGESV